MATVIQSGLEHPWHVAFSGDGRMFVTERGGWIRVYASGERDADLLSMTQIPMVRAEQESGAMGIATHPDFDTSPNLYVCASRDPDGEGDEPWTNDILTYIVGEDGGLTEGEHLAVGVIRASRQHDGCAVEVDQSGHLWISVGDVLRGPELPQDPGSFNGKILRMDLDGSVPVDNPVMPGTSQRSWIYTMGHRNPQGLAINPESGAVYNAEHGARVEDEINRVVAGGNYGWPCYTGRRPNPAPEDDRPCEISNGYESPSWSSGDQTIATSGLTFLYGEQWGSWRGQLIVATLKEMDLRLMSIESDGEVKQSKVLFDGVYGRLRGVAIAPDGALYVTTSNGVDDKIIRIEPTTEL